MPAAGVWHAPISGRIAFAGAHPLGEEGRSYLARVHVACAWMSWRAVEVFEQDLKRTSKTYPLPHRLIGRRRQGRHLQNHAEARFGDDFEVWLIGGGSQICCLLKSGDCSGAIAARLMDAAE